MIKQLVQTKVLQDIVTYLESRPYREVSVLIKNLIDNVTPFDDSVVSEPKDTTDPSKK